MVMADRVARDPMGDFAARTLLDTSTKNSVISTCLTLS